MTKRSNKLVGCLLASILVISFLAISQFGNHPFISKSPSAPSYVFNWNPLLDLDYASAEWVFESISEQAVSDVIRDTIRDQEIWMRTPDATVDDKYFSCTPLSLKKPSKFALAAFNEADKPDSGPMAKFSYVEAAREGYWRAAARLVTLNLDEGFPLYAVPLVAWLLQNKVPAGHNLLADILVTHAEGPEFDPAGLGTSLRWRAALNGDPDALSKMAGLLTREGEPQFAKTLRDCAERNRQTFGEYEESPWDSFLQWLLEAGSTP